MMEIRRSSDQNWWNDIKFGISIQAEVGRLCAIVEAPDIDNHVWQVAEEAEDFDIANYET